MAIRKPFPTLPSLIDGANIRVPPTPRPFGAKTLVGVDLGWASELAAVVASVTPCGVLHIEREQVFRNLPLEIVASMWPKPCNGGPVFVALGPDANQHRAEQPVSASEQLSALGHSPIVIRRPRRERIIALMSAIAIPESPIRLRVSPTCAKTLRALANYSATMADDGGIEVHTPHLSHCVDAVSYAVLAAYIATAPERHAGRQSLTVLPFP